MSGADRLDGIRDVFGAYKMLSALHLNSKAELGFVLKHLAKVCDGESEEPGLSPIIDEDNKDLARIRTVYKAYEKLRKWVPEEAEKVLVEHLQTILELTDTSTIPQQRSEPIQIKKEKTEVVTVKNEEIASDSEQASPGDSAMATTSGQLLSKVIVKNEEQAFNLDPVSMNEASPGESPSSSLPSLPTVKSENNCDMSIIIRLRREHNITKDIKITIEKIPLNYLCPKPNKTQEGDYLIRKGKKRGPYKKRMKNQLTNTAQSKSLRFGEIHKEVLNTKSKADCRCEPMNFITINEIPVTSSSGRGDPANKACICVKCDKVRSDQSAFKKPVPYHLLPKSFECKLCKKSFKLKYQLTKHERVHTGERPYSCKYCQKSFSTSTQLKVHIRIHTGEKPYNCKYCPKAFSQVGSLTLHERIHTGEKNYKCKHCQMAFVGHTVMRKHEKTHDTTREYKFECKFCQKKFLHKYSLRDHEKYFVCRKGMPKLSKF